MKKIPFVQAYKVGGKQKPRLIVLRASMTSSDEGSALAIAHYWNQSNATESCHYVVDEAKIYQCVSDRVVSLPSTFGPPGSLTINLCVEPRFSVIDWNDPQKAKVISLTAELISRLVISHRIPVQYVTGLEEYKWYMWRRRSRGGIVLDLKGDWPREHFLAEVHYRLLQKR